MSHIEINNTYNLGIQDLRVAYKPFSHPKYFEYFKQALSTVWRVETVDMNSDILNYQTGSIEEQEIIQGILKGFTILETRIGDYWSDIVPKIFPKHEIVAACRAFAFFEVIHSQAYSHLSDCLGLNDYNAFLDDPTTKTKIEYFVEHPNKLVSLAVFSGAGEGVALFSSFAVLLSLSRNGRYKGLAQIISWSISDEMTHSDMGCALFKDLVLEKGITEEEEELIYEGFRTVLDNEFNFINQIFNNRLLPFINSEDLKQYMYLRANNRLEALGLTPIFSFDKRAYNISNWFLNEVIGQSSHDFFAQAINGDNYTSLLKQDFNNFNYSNVDFNWANQKHSTFVK